MRTYSERIAKGTIAVLAFGLAGTLLGYGLRIYLARNLSVAEFGLFYSVLAFLSFFGMFKDMGLSSAVAKMIPEFRVKGDASSIKTVVKSSVKIQAAAGAAISISIFLLSDYVAAGFFHEPAAKSVLQILSVEFFIGFSVLKAVLQGFQKTRLYSVIEPARILLVFAFLLVFMGFGANGAAASYLLSAVVINAALAVYISAKLCRPYFKSAENPAVAGRMMKFGLIVFAGSLASMLISTTDTLMITFFLSVKDVALYQVAMPTSQLLLVFSSAITVVMLPVASEMCASKRMDMLGAASSLILKFLFIFMVPFVLIFVAFPEIILNAVFGGSYYQASQLLQTLSVGMIFYSLFAVMFALIIGIGKPKTAAKIVAYTAALNFVMNLFLINSIGINGAAVSAAISYAVAAAASYSVLRKHMKISFAAADIAKIFACGAAATMAVFWMKSSLSMEPVAEAAASLAAGLLFYAVLVIMSKTLKKSDIKMLDRINIRIPKSVTRFLCRLVD